MSEIQIILNTTGSIVVSNIRFTPSMVNATIETDNIYFPPNFILNDKNILRAVKDSSSTMEILTNLSMYEKLVRYYTDEARGYKKISLEQAKTRGVIKNNAEYMKKIWFKPNSKIFIKNRAYTIVSSKIEQQPEKIKTQNIIFKMTVNIQLAKDNSWLGRQQLTCAEKRDNINIIYKSLFNKPLFSYREITNRYTETPVMYSNNSGTVSKYTPTKASFNPYPRITNNYYYTGNPTQLDSFSRPLMKTAGGKKRTYKRFLKRSRANRTRARFV